MIITKSTKGMSRQEWLSERRKGIGGSDAAAILGLSKWASPYSVWADKTGRLPEQEETEAMRQGTDLEEYVASRFEAETGKKVHRVNAIIRNTDWPFAHANIDRKVAGESAFLECKTTSSLDLKQFRGVEFPERYYCQCVHYLAVTGYERCYLAVLVLGREFHVYTLERDEDEIRALMNAEDLFWEQYIELDTPPAPDGSEASTEALRTIYPESTEDAAVQLYGRDGLLDERKALLTQRDALTARIDEIENIIKQDMGTAERAASDAWSVTWKTQQRRSLVTAVLQKDHPELDLSPYYKITTTRTFRVKEI